MIHCCIYGYSCKKKKFNILDSDLSEATESNSVTPLDLNESGCVLFFVLLIALIKVYMHRIFFSVPGIDCLSLPSNCHGLLVRARSSRIIM